MRVLVTGGAGYIGSELVHKLAHSEDVSEVVVYDNLARGNTNLFISSSNKMPKGKVTFVLGDLLDSRKLRKAMSGIDIVYHLAAKVTHPEESVDSHVFEQNNNWGTAEVAYAVEEEDSVKKIVHVSSMGVYGFSKKDEPIQDENFRLNPRSFYSISKMRSEEHILRLSGKKEVVVIRCANVYGYSPAIRFDSVINRFLFDAHFKNRISIHGSGKQKRSFVCLDSVIKVLDHLKNNSVEDGIYNLVGRSMSVLDIVDVFKEIYPSLEFIFINQHLNLQDLVVDSSSKLMKHILFDCKEFKPEIEEIKSESFAF